MATAAAADAHAREFRLANATTPDQASDGASTAQKPVSIAPNPPSRASPRSLLPSSPSDRRSSHPAGRRRHHPAAKPVGPAFILPSQPAAAVSTPSAVATGEIPVINYKAYKNAADTMARTTPGCGIPWTIIGGIGRVESHHANMGDALRRRH